LIDAFRVELVDELMATTNDAVRRAHVQMNDDDDDDDDDDVRPIEFTQAPIRHGTHNARGAHVHRPRIVLRQTPILFEHFFAAGLCTSHVAVGLSLRVGRPPRLPTHAHPDPMRAAIPRAHSHWHSEENRDGDDQRVNHSRLFTERNRT
jgi:hypothetical protein